MSVIYNERYLLIRFDRKYSSTHLFAGFANILVIGAFDFETFNDAGLPPLAYIVTSQLCSASFDISPQHLICPLLRNDGDVLYPNPGRILIWASSNNNGFTAVWA